MEEDYGQRLAAALVIEVKAAMVRAGISSSRALGRAIGQNSQYISNRLDGGNPRTGERVPLNVRDLADIGEVLGVAPHVLVQRAEDALEAEDAAQADPRHFGLAASNHGVDRELPNQDEPA